MAENVSNEYNFKHEDLFKVWHYESDLNKKTTSVFNFVFNEIEKSDISDEYVITSRNKIRIFCVNLSIKWKNCSRNLDYFLKKNKKWLEKFFSIKRFINENPEPSTEDSESLPSTSVRCGRPRLSYEEKSLRSQRREASTLSAEMDEPIDLIIMSATSMTARKTGKTDLAVILTETTKSPHRPTKMRKILFGEKKEPVPFTIDEALSYFYDNSLSKRQYINMRLENKDKNCDIFPTYNAILERKMVCRPPGILITELSAKVPLKNLLNHTIKRIILLQNDVIDSVVENINDEIVKTEIIFSYGFDGSNSQSTYKQGFQSSTLPGLDNTLFATTLIPLQFSINNKTILWNNSTPQSVRFCRPIKLEYAKETQELILNEKKNLDDQINNLVDLNIPHNNKILQIKFKLMLTLIDGKVLNTLTGTKSSQSCPICGATPTQIIKINDFHAKEFEPKQKVNLCYGLSPLHLWIRVFECIIHIAYRLEIKKWQVKLQEDKEKLRQRKNEIQKLFWERLALNVDKPKQGSGNTNDGNTARRAFQDLKTLSEITGVDLKLLHNFKIILITISCNFPINFNEFEKFCFETGHIYKEKYPWYPMPPSIHKVLIHGSQIIVKCGLPPGCLGEEGSEARNKCYRHDRQFHARKNSRRNNLEDVFNRAMETSDPLISSITLRKRLQNQKRLKLPTEVLSLLHSPLNAEQETTPTEESCDDEAVFYENDADALPIFSHLDNLELDSEDFD